MSQDDWIANVVKNKFTDLERKYAEICETMHKAQAELYQVSVDLKNLELFIAKLVK